MGKLNMNSDQITDFEVKQVQESVDFKSISLKVCTNSSEVRYRICSDRNHPDLDKIQNDLETGLKKALNTNKDIYFNDYEERHYVYVTFPDGTHNKYTAQKK